MGLARVDKVQILADSSVKMEVLSALQEAGIIQPEEVKADELGLKLPYPQVSAFDHLLHRLKNALDFLSRWEEHGFVEKLLKQKPRLGRQEKEELLQFPYLPVLEKIEKLEEAKNEVLSERRFIEREIEFLLPLQNLSLPLACLEKQSSLEIVPGFLPLHRMEDFEALASTSALWYELILQEKRHSILLLYFLKKEKDFFGDRLRELQFSPIVIADTILEKAGEEDRIIDIIARSEKARDEKGCQVEALEKEAMELKSSREKLAQIYDVILNEREKIATSRLLGETEKVVYLEGWIKSADIARLRSALLPYASESEVYVRPPAEDEEPPVILENPRAVKPFEVITRLYGLPHQDSIDPTISLTPFFFVFVGLCVSEAGYGLLVALLSLLYIKFARPKGNALQFMRLLFLLGVSNIILGTVVGGWFGFPIRQLLLLDPLKDPLSFLILALALGFVQVWFGTLLNMITSLRRKFSLQPIFVQGGWLVMLPSLVAYGLTKQQVWGIFSLLGASGVVLFASPSKNPILRVLGGLYGLYDISKYLGDVLSYSRLLALGLATGVIAMVVNTLCQTALGIPWVGWFFAALIFIGGHLFNLAISFLGGFVHSMRLQFVEFFTKFFKSGGRPFKPFRLEGKYVEFI